MDFVTPLLVTAAVVAFFITGLWVGYRRISRKLPSRIRGGLERRDRGYGIRRSDFELKLLAEDLIRALECRLGEYRVSTYWHQGYGHWVITVSYRDTGRTAYHCFITIGDVVERGVDAVAEHHAGTIVGIVNDAKARVLTTLATRFETNDGEVP